MESLAFLENSGRGKPRHLYVLHGDEDFLKRQVLLKLRELILGEEGGEFGYSAHPGDKATFAEVIDEVATLPFLSPTRMVVVENADPFVTRHRAALEKFVESASARGVLVLDVRSWTATTRLAKMVDAASTIVCKAPQTFRLPEWCARWCLARHGKPLAAQAARLLVDLIGPDMGPLDQEMEKLAIFVGKAAQIEAADVDLLVGGSRTTKTFEIIKALAERRPQEAFSLLERCFDLGEDPLRILGAFGMQLRRLAQVAHLARNGVPLQEAAKQVGIPPFALQDTEKQLRHLGKQRIDKIYDWLLEADSGMKGASPLPEEAILERLLARMTDATPVAKR